MHSLFGITFISRGAFVQFSTFMKYGCSGKLNILGDEIILELNWLSKGRGFDSQRGESDDFSPSQCGKFGRTSSMNIEYTRDASFRQPSHLYCIGIPAEDN